MAALKPLVLGDTLKAGSALSSGETLGRRFSHQRRCSHQGNGAGRLAWLLAHEGHPAHSNHSGNIAGKCNRDED